MLKKNHDFDLSTYLFYTGIIITLFFLIIALSANFWQHIGVIKDPLESLANPIHQAPDSQYWWGTTGQGYDVFSRTIFGTQTAFKVVILATSLSLIIGVPLGLVSGYFGGNLDKFLLFIMDTIYTLPGLLLSITLAFVVGRGILNASIALSISYIPQYYRVVRNQTTSVKNELFVEAATATGAGEGRILSKYIFFNVVQSIPVLFTLNTADAILILGGLGFLGLGLPDNVPEWGYDLRLALDGLPTGIWWTAFFPGFTMTLMVTGLSLLGEGLTRNK
ncbi:MAG: ABC transporter permease [Cyanobacterium sp. T60_A2020_053]|nr:ABC transporter permease [Cyanobacterium sp. T60_A2020_053]